MSTEPEKIDKYIIKRRMGEGAMGEVLEGFDPVIERRVAIKRLHPHLVQADPKNQFLSRFKQEAQAAARCSHPNIVTILEYGEHNQAPYIVMEYVEGINLHKLLQKQRVSRLKHIINFIAQIVKALHTAHEHGVIHRDIKPANIIVMNNGVVKLADFGIARLPVDRNLTQVGVAIGTPRYMSPEQAMAHPTDQRTDLYAVTMIFAQMLTGIELDPQIPADLIPNIEGISKSHYVNHTVPVPTPFIPLLVKGLAFDPDKRIANAREYLTLLKSAVNALKPEARARIDAEKASVSKPSPAGAAVDPIELESLQTILSDYIGPIARNVIKSEAGQYHESSDLARAVASEIPDITEREAFMRDWESKSGERAARRAGETTTGGSYSTNSYLPETVRVELEKSFAGYVGPMAGRLIERYQGKCRSLSGLVKALGEEIPDASDKTAFALRWSKIVD